MGHAEGAVGSNAAGRPFALPNIVVLTVVDGQIAHLRDYVNVVTEPTSALRVAAGSLDCADHIELAGFYVRLLEGTLLWTHEKAAAIESGGVVLVMQRTEDYQPPVWPGASIVHLDLYGSGPVDQLERRAITLGAQPAQTQPDSRWQVLLDPAAIRFASPFRKRVKTFLGRRIATRR